MRKLFFFIIVVTSLFIINNLVKSIYSLWQKQDLIVKVKQAVEKEKKKNLQLKQQLISIKSPEFVEQEARDKLFLSKPGEQIIILPSPNPPPQLYKTVEKGSQPAWRKWWNLFF